MIVTRVGTVNVQNGQQRTEDWGIEFEPGDGPMTPERFKALAIGYGTFTTDEPVAFVGPFNPITLIHDEPACNCPPVMIRDGAHMPGCLWLEARKQ